MQWYYAKSGQVRGPVEGEEFDRLSRDGLIAAGDLVWNESFGSEWRPARTVPEYLAACQGEAGGEGSAGPADGVQAISRAERGATPNRELMADARAALRGQWGLGVGAVVLFFVVSFAMGMASSLADLWVPLSGNLISFALSGPLTLGFYALFLGILRRTSPGIGTLFDGFRRFGSALWMYVLIAVFTLLWCLLAVVPGAIVAGFVLAGKISFAALSQGSPPFDPSLTGYIFGVAFGLVLLPVIVVSVIIQLRYSQSYFILLDQPGEGALAAIRGSVEITSGRKWKLFCLYLRFIGWSILCVFTCGIGFLWLMPYMMTSYARFYEDVRT